MPPADPSEVAARDQWLTFCRINSEKTFDLFDAYVAVGFSREEALDLVFFFLEMGHSHDPST